MRKILRAMGVALFALSGADMARAETVEDQVLALINKERAKAGCPALVVDPRLTAAAELHARDMAENNFHAHQGADGSSPESRVKAQGFRVSRLGENIAAGYQNAPQAVSGWMSSKAHRANILSCRFTETGIGMIHQPDDKKLSGQPVPYYFYWVQVFAGS